MLRCQSQNFLTLLVIISMQANAYLVVLFFADKERPIAEKFVHNMVNRAIELEGTVTGEHGVGLVKRDYLKHEVGEATVDLMRKVSYTTLEIPISKV